MVANNLATFPGLFALVLDNILYTMYSLEIK